MGPGGRDPSAIFRAMQERFKPLIDAGKAREAETELDQVLEMLDQVLEMLDQPVAADTVLPPTTPRADRGPVWYTVGNLSVDLLARAWGSPIVELMRKSEPPSGAHAQGADRRPGARRARVAGRTAHATDEWPAI